MRRSSLLLSLVLVAIPVCVSAQTSAPKDSPASQSSASGVSSSSDKKHVRQTVSTELESGAVENGVYRNRALAMTCRIPEGWVLRTEEMNEREDDEAHPLAESVMRTARTGAGKVLLAAFSRPPAAHGEDVNSSILIAAESASAYPGLKEPVQYLGVLEEVPKSQGFTVDAGPDEIAIGPKTLVREDFHKDVGSRVMRQTILAMLARGYAISITVIGGTEDEVEELLDGLSFSAK